MRPLTEEEWQAVTSRKEDPAAIDAVTMTVGQLDGVEDEAPTTAAPAQQVFQQPAPAPAPAPAPVAAKPVAQPKPVATPKASGFTVTKNVAPPAEAEEVPEPTVRDTGKATAPNVSSILQDWATDD